MNRKFTWLCAAMMLISFNSAWAQEDEGDATIRLMGAAEAELPEAVTKDIELPEGADEEAVENAVDGLAKANERHERRENGLSTADEARDNAMDNAENRGRAEDLPVDVPGRPDAPGTPDVPDAPQRPTG